MTPLFESALDLAYEAHRGQTRKNSKLPYIIHPLQVCARLQKWGLEIEKEEILHCSAILHDVLEDTDTNPREILSKLTISGAISDIFDEEAFTVLDIVQELTFDESLEGEERKVKKAEYMNSFFKSSLEALIIKVADRLCNIQDYYDFPDTRVYSKKYYKKGKEIFEARHKRETEIAERFGLSVFKAMYTDYLMTLDKVNP